MKERRAVKEIEGRRKTNGIQNEKERDRKKRTRDIFREGTH